MTTAATGRCCAAPTARRSSTRSRASRDVRDRLRAGRCPRCLPRHPRCCWPGTSRTPSPALGAGPAADRLRWVHTASAGVDNVLTPDVMAASVRHRHQLARGVRRPRSPSTSLGLVLMIAKDLIGTWERQQRPRVAAPRHRTSGRCDAVVVGVGPIGRATAALLGSGGPAGTRRWAARRAPATPTSGRSSRPPSSLRCCPTRTTSCSPPPSPTRPAAWSTVPLSRP